MRESVKMRIVAYDLLGIAEQWLDKYADQNHMELCEIIGNSSESGIDITELPYYEGWDYLLVFERDTKHLIAPLLEKIGLEDNIILYALDIEESLCVHREISYYIFNDTMRDYLDFYRPGQRGDSYMMVSSPQYSYVNVSSDREILFDMFTENRNWAEEEMRTFYRISNQYYQFSDKQKLFCDIGANIGTTSIFFRNHLDNDIRILAFEPSPENYKLLKTNMVLNNLDPNEHILVNKGVSDKFDRMMFRYDRCNPGASKFISGDLVQDETEMIDVVSFDDYLEANSIDPEAIKYIWIDVEGFEPRFLAGASKTLSRIKVPVLMEFVPRFYSGKEREFDLLIESIERLYSGFILISDPDYGPVPIERLRQERNNMETAWDIMLLKD